MPTFILNSKVYEFCKWVVMIVLPAFSALYFGLAQLYNWTNGEQVVGTLAIVTVFLGSILGISSKNYNSSDAKFDGEVVMQQDPATGKLIYSLDLNDDIPTLVGKDSITFKVTDPDPT
jgi:hypothetical protein